VRPAAAFALVAALFGCEPPPPELLNHDLVFVVTSDVGDPVPGVRLFRPGAEIGQTGKDGRLAARFQAPDSAQLIVHAQCPDGYVDPVEDTRIVLRQLSVVAARESHGRQVFIQCRRARVIAAVVVRAGFPDLPVLHDGQEVARTGLSGVAHVSAAVPPHETFSLVVDTSSAERLRPKDPATTYTMGSEDETFVFDTGLVQLPVPKKVKHKRKPKPGPPPPPRPILVPPNAHLGVSPG
jgi:hypothetical protein